MTDSRPPQVSRSVREALAEHGAVLLLFTLLTIALTWPVTALFGQGINAFGDVVLQMTAMTWDAHALLTNPLGLAEAPFFYPYAHSNAFSEHLVGETLVGLPLFWLTGGDPAPAHNFNFLLSFVLTGYFTYLLVRDLTGSRAAGVAAGIAYAFTGYRFVQSGHLNILATEWFPFTLWALRRGLRRNHGGYWALAAAGIVCMGLFSVYFLYFLAVLVGLYLVWWIIRGRRVAADGLLVAMSGGARGARQLPVLGKAAAAGLAAGLLLLPLYWPYLQVNQELGLARSAYEVQGWAARPWYFGNVLPTNWLWATFVPGMVGNRGERQMFPGLVITGLAVLGLLGGRRRAMPEERPGRGGAVPSRPRLARLTGPPRDERGFYLLLAGVAVVLTFGMSIRLPGLPWDIPLPYAALYSWVPGFTALRVPVRFVVLLDLALAVLGGYGLAGLLAWWTRPARVLLLPLLALMTLEYVQVRDLGNHRDMRPPDPEPYTWLAAHPGPVADLPMSDSLFGNVWATYWATYNWQPLLSGAGSFMPSGTVEIARVLAGFPDPPSIALLQGLEVRHVVVHLSQYAPGERRALAGRLNREAALHQVFAHGDDLVYELAPDQWATRLAGTVPAGGDLWVDRGSSNSAPVLESIAYALKYNRLPGAAPVRVTGNLPIGNRSLPPLPYGRPPARTLLPTGDPGRPAGSVVLSNALVTAVAPPAGLRAVYDLTAANAPYGPRGLAVSAAPVRLEFPGLTPAPGEVELLVAAFASTGLTIGETRVDLPPGLSRVRLPLAPATASLSLQVANGPGGPPLVVRAGVRDSPNAPIPGLGSDLMTNTLVLDLQTGSVDRATDTLSASWRVVAGGTGGPPLTLSLDVYQEPFGTHPDGHLGSWSLPLPAGNEGRDYRITLDPVAKTATALLNGAPTSVFAWQGPPHGGDFAATLNLLAADRLLAQLPLYHFTVEDARITDFQPANGTLLLVPLTTP